MITEAARPDCRVHILEIDWPMERAWWPDKHPPPQRDGGPLTLALYCYPLSQVKYRRTCPDEALHNEALTFLAVKSLRLALAFLKGLDFLLIRFRVELLLEHIFHDKECLRVLYENFCATNSELVSRDLWYLLGNKIDKLIEPIHIRRRHDVHELPKVLHKVAEHVAVRVACTLHLDVFEQTQVLDLMLHTCTVK